MSRWPAQWHPRARLTAAALAGTLAAAGLVAFPVSPASAADYPGQDEIAAARAAAADAATGVAQLDAAIAQLEDALHKADVTARLADEDYHIAHDAAVSAERQLYAANERADEAEDALADARTGLAAVAMASYRNAGSMGDLEAIVSADGFDDVVTRSEAISRASADADSTVQQVHAAEIVAATTRDYAEQAAVRAEEAEQAAEDALATAQAAREDAERAVADASTARSAAVNRLAELRGVTAELEQERQDGLAAERAARERAQFEEEQRRAEQAAQAEKDRQEQASSGGGTQTDNEVEPEPRPTQTSQPRPTETSEPKPAETSEPKPTETSAPEPEQTTEPAPEETTEPEPEPEPEPETSWRSSASQGSRAASHSLTLVGAPYAYAGNGPAYDCSGITYASWRSAGITIPRSSRTQYAGVTRLPYSQLRKGDLVFWGSGRNASAIYHVAIYVGGGKVMEAQTYGSTAQVRSMYSWAVGDMMPYIGRP